MNYQYETDETLVMLTLAGEQQAYEVLVTRYQKAVIASALSVTKSRFMAEDAAQDAFVTAWMKLNTLQDPQKYASWVCRIAKNCGWNMMTRYRSFLPLDVVDNLDLYGSGAENPAELYALSEERSEVNKTVELLPEKVRQIIYLHYFEDLSIAEIADRMRISRGTVKWQLHDGRKRIRKELCAMNEKYNDTLVQRVMKKVEELKLWQVKSDKSGFETVYREVLRQVEELDECIEKQHALADVLMRGWWWLPGKKNDALFARIAESAMKGKNEEVMTFIVAREDSKVYDGARIDFIRDKQIPRLEKAGFVKTLGREWFWLGYYLFQKGRAEEGHAAYRKVEEILQKEDAYRVLVPYARTMEEELATRYQTVAKEHYLIGGTAEEYRILDGVPRYWNSEGFSNGYLGSIDRRGLRIFQNASACDGSFFADLPVGGTCAGSDGTKLSFLSEDERVETPAGIFEHCQLWEVRRWTDVQKIVCRTYYKDGIGIVRQDHSTDGVTDTRLLKSYEIKGGTGLLPFCAGNTWAYASQHSPDAVLSQLNITVSAADGQRILLAYWENTQRLGYNETSWVDTVQEIANEYCRTKEDSSVICDVYSVIDRAERLAKTSMEQAHTKAAASVVRRILDTDPVFNPNHKATGHWNFFGREYLRKTPDGLSLTDYNPRWSFEWKRGSNMDKTPLLFNDILGILQDAANCLWSDEWRIGSTPMMEYSKWDRMVKTKISCEDGGTITTKAGTFENCFKLCLDIEGMNGGWSHRGGKKVYYFAPGIGIVRTENEYCNGAKTAVYELTSYHGAGEGFLPFGDGFVRRYDALDLTDGFVASTEYAIVADEDGDLVVFSDQTGIRQAPPPITHYGSIQGEVVEDLLCNEGKWTEGQLKNAANNFHLILHLLARPGRNIFNAKRSIETNGFYRSVMELLGDDGEVPPAWYGVYTWVTLIQSAALFGDGQKEEGYQALDLAADYCEKIAQFHRGDLLDAGKKELLGGILYEYAKDCILLPDGSKEPVSYDRMNFNARNLLYCITSHQGWEWFNSVRNEGRFRDYVQRIETIVNKTGKA